MTYIDTSDPIARMNAAKDARRHRGLGSARKARFQTVHAETGHYAERRDLLASLAQLEAYSGRELVNVAHYLALDNDEVRELIEGHFDYIANTTFVVVT